jgi:hypothetical protein
MPHMRKLFSFFQLVGTSITFRTSITFLFLSFRSLKNSPESSSMPISFSASLRQMHMVTMMISCWISNLFKGKRSIAAVEEPVEITLPSDVAWNNFLSSKALNTILTARHKRQLPNSPTVWSELCREACKLWNQLDKEGLVDNLPTVYPTLCLLIKGNYYFQNCPNDSQRLMFEEEPYTNVVRSAAACPTSPYSFVKRLLDTQKHQLVIADYSGRKTPLHVLCGNEMNCHRSNKESLVALFVKSFAKAATDVDSEGMYPLHIACKAKCTWSTGIEALVNAAPQVALLEYRNQSPFLITVIAHAKQVENVHSYFPSHPTVVNQKALDQFESEVLGTLFELLRLDPSVIASLYQHASFAKGRRYSQ